MKARFLEQQKPVKFVVLHGKTYVYICTNEQAITETMEGVETTQYEYDYHEFFANSEDIDRNDIVSNPEKYIDYDPNAKMDYEVEIEKLKKENEELKEDAKKVRDSILELSELLM